LFPHPKRGFFLTDSLSVREMRVASGVPTVKTTFSGGFLAQAENPRKTASRGALERKKRARRRENTLLE
jgi:hypothetical protein